MKVRIIACDKCKEDEVSILAGHKTLAKFNNGIELVEHVLRNLIKDRN